jgi:hypothetical protein
VILAMRRIALLLPLLLAPAACEHGDAAVAAGVNDLRIEIIRGKGMRAVVRDPAVPAGQDQLAPDPVTVRVVVSPDAEEQARQGVTGPETRWRIPPVEVQWRALEPWCTPLLASTPIHGDTASNFHRRPTRTGVCRLVAEGISGGRAFDTDTAVLSVEPGPVASFAPPTIVAWTYIGDQVIPWLISRPEDAYGNDILEPPAFVATLTSGAPLITIRDDTLLHATQEAVGGLRLTAGSATRDMVLWSFRGVRNHWWSLSWRCYDLALPGGGRADSAHFWMDSALVRFGGISPRGVNVAVSGGLHRRMWMPGQPPRDTLAGVARFAAARPRQMIWHNGQTAAGTPDGSRYDGGDLCEPPPEGGAWARFGPASLVRGDSIPDPDNPGG